MLLELMKGKAGSEGSLSKMDCLETLERADDPPEMRSRTVAMPLSRRPMADSWRLLNVVDTELNTLVMGESAGVPAAAAPYASAGS